MNPTLKRSLLFSACGVFVIGLHAALFFWSSQWRTTPETAVIEPVAMVIQLAPAIPTPKPPAQAAPEPLPEPPKIVEAPKPRLELSPPKPPRPPRPPRPEQPKPVEPTPAREPEPSVAQSSPAAEPAAPTNVAPIAAAGPSAEEVRWEHLLMAHIARYQEYPYDARKRHLEGAQVVHLRLDANGHVLDYEFEKSSGHRSLDRATRQLIRRAQPFPKPPASRLQSGSVQVIAPITYNLTR